MRGSCDTADLDLCGPYDMRKSAAASASAVRRVRPVRDMRSAMSHMLVVGAGKYIVWVYC